jgi:phosphopantothenoylcysteine decarboxylase/phosphopantothenate--cysteine ligase
MFAPAMDHDMFLHPGTQANISKLISFGHLLVQPAEGALASGLVGKGRMAEPDEIFDRILAHFHPDLPLTGKTVLITAGPTYELIDPVRFIGNFSTGKMGFALAAEFAALGAEVHLVSGPSKEQIHHPKVKRTDVVTGSEMYAACEANYKDADIVVFSAAVADYKPVRQADQKIKKAGSRISLELEQTRDIAGSFGVSKTAGKIHVGFALETENEMVNGFEKLQKKNFDLLVLNSLRDEGAGFGKDTNKITLIWPGNKTESFGLKSKSAVAHDIAQAVIKLIKK